MRIGRKPSFVIGALALGLLAGGTAAADETGEFDLGLFAGYHIASNTNDIGFRGGQATSTDSGPLFGLRAGYGLFPHVGLEVEGAFLYSHTRADTSDTYIGVVYRANVLIRVTPDNLGGALFLVGGVGGITIGDSNDKATPTSGVKSDTKFWPHAGLAGKVNLGDNWGLRMDGRVFFAGSFTDDRALDWEGTASLWYVWGRKPKTPPAPPDRDGDGVADKDDACPDQPGLATADPKTNGCPPPADKDADGIPDAQDACPDQPGPASSDPKTNGCPPAPDKDADGVPDAQDACPDVAGVKTDDPKTNGCPPDRDGDGITDDKDKCPDQPETKNGYQDEDGCPDEVPKAVQKFTGTIKGINFETNSSKITKGSFTTLDAAAKVLQDYPSVRMEIQGHTDDTGDHDYNLKLSQDRAQSVKDYLIAKGVAENRLKAQGYGPDKPLDPAKTKAARAKNRRVEFQMLLQ
jgi:outer membrane protein OmpA-like peptidoglycan-associated protein